METKIIQQQTAAAQLSYFLEKIKDDPRIGPLHISLYLALLYQSQSAAPSAPIHLDRQFLMRQSKILGKSAYYKCLKELAVYGYIEYKPEHYPGKQSVARPL